MSAVTVVLVTFDSAAVIGDALASLPHGTPTVVVDNASSDDSAAIAEHAGAHVIRRPSNAGFGVANNDGWRVSTTPYVFFLNPDTRLHTGAIEALAAALDAVPDAAIAVPTLYRADGSVFAKRSSPITASAFRARGGLPPDMCEVGFASGAALLVRRDVLAQVDGFDPAIFLYFEDDDLSRRVLEAGHRILYVPAAAVTHAGNGSSPATPALQRMKHWHLAWSERYVRRRFGLPVWSRWRILECAVKRRIAGHRRDLMEMAKQDGLIAGTRAALRGVMAQDVRGEAATEGLP